MINDNQIAGRQSLDHTPSQYERSIISFLKNIVIYVWLACKDEQPSNVF